MILLPDTTALVTLHFTPMSKKLSSIHINIMDADKAQQKEVILPLSKQEQTEVKTFEQHFKTRYRQQDKKRM
jgi:hypothetical protein